MKLDTIDQRHKLIDDMIQKGFEFEEGLIHVENTGDDWGGAMSTVENLTVIEEMIRAEMIFLSALSEIESVRTRNDDLKATCFKIVDDGFVQFVDTILLSRIEHAFDHLNGWKFESADAKKFQKSYCKKLDALSKIYRDLYDL